MPITKSKGMPRRNVLWIDEETRAKDVSGKVYIVTGANSGVGLETTRQLVTQGGHVVMACRRPDAGEEVAKSFSGLKGSYNGGWPLTSPNPNARNMDTARKLVDLSYELVGLKQE